MDDSYLYHHEPAAASDPEVRPHPPDRPPSPSPSVAASPLGSLHELGRSLGLPSRSHRRSASTSSAPATSNPPMSPSIQDRLLSRMLQQVLPSDYPVEDYANMKDKRKDLDRPGFSLTLMSNNFRRFNSRIGVVFVAEHRLRRLLSWKHPTHTLSFLALYTFVCLDPYLVFVLPSAMTLLFIMVPSFITRHPPPPSGMPLEKYSARGPALAPPPEVKAVSEMSKDFFRNLRDLQNSMDDFSVAHDKIISTVGPPTNFSDETVSSAVFLILFFATVALFVSARYLPWRAIFLVAGWLAVCLNHPSLKDILLETHATHLAPRERRAGRFADSWVHRDILLDATPETREVEVFELQRLTSSGEYESWMFSPTPYEPLSPQRIAAERPKGTRFFEDVRAPPGWEWSDMKWTLDLGSRLWVEERCVNGVEVEEEGERWVYDYDDHGRGKWRRRRWVRAVKRKYVTRQEG